MKDFIKALATKKAFEKIFLLKTSNYYLTKLEDIEEEFVIHYRMEFKSKGIAKESKVAMQTFLSTWSLFKFSRNMRECVNNHLHWMR